MVVCGCVRRTSSHQKTTSTREAVAFPSVLPAGGWTIHRRHGHGPIHQIRHSSVAEIFTPRHCWWFYVETLSCNKLTSTNLHHVVSPMSHSLGKGFWNWVCPVLTGIIFMTISDHHHRSWLVTVMVYGFRWVPKIPQYHVSSWAAWAGLKPCRFLQVLRVWILKLNLVGGLNPSETY